MIETVIAELKGELAKIEHAIAALAPLWDGERPKATGRGGKRYISPAGRAKISAAMKARWAKVRK